MGSVALSIKGSYGENESKEFWLNGYSEKLALSFPFPFFTQINE